MLGLAIGGNLTLNPLGEMVMNVWRQIPERYPGIEVDIAVVMPNHFHGIVVVGAGSHASPSPINGRPQGGVPTLSLPGIVHRFKSLTHENTMDPDPDRNEPSPRNVFWQRSFYDRVIRNDRELNAIREYIQANPGNWDHGRRLRVVGADPRVCPGVGSPDVEGQSQGIAPTRSMPSVTANTCDIEGRHVTRPADRTIECAL